MTAPVNVFAAHATAYNEGVYGKKYPDSRFMIGERGCYATWMPGRNFENRSRLYGAYPPDFPSRALSMFPDANRILHLFSGSLTAEQVEEDWVAAHAGRAALGDLGDGRHGLSLPLPFQVRFDSGLHPLAHAAMPDVRGDAEDLSTYAVDRPGRVVVLKDFDVVLADPPYDESDQRIYWQQSLDCAGCGKNYLEHTKVGRGLQCPERVMHVWSQPQDPIFVPLHKKKVIEQARLVLKPGGFLVWLDCIRPFYANVDWTFAACVTILRSTGHRVRIAYVLQKTENNPETA